MFKRSIFTSIATYSLFFCSSCQKIDSSSKVLNIPKLTCAHDLVGIYPKTVEEVQAIKDKGLACYDRALSKFLSESSDLKTFDEIVTRFDRINGEFCYSIDVLSVVSLIHPEEALRDAATKASEDMQKALVRSRMDHPELYTIFERVTKEEGLNAKEQYYLNEILTYMKQEGLHVDAVKREELKRLQSELLELGTAFEKNIRDDSSHILVSKEALAGVQDTIIQSLKRDYYDRYYVTCDYPTYFAVMEYCDVESTRKALYEVFNNRAYPANISVLQGIIEKQDCIASTLEYPSSAHRDLSTMMIKTPSHARKFIQELFVNSEHKMESELKVLKAKAPTNITFSEEGKINPWDLAYLQRYVKNQMTNLDQNILREYFAQDTTIKKLIHIYETFFSFTITEESNQGLWDPSLKVLKIQDAQNEMTYGYVILDLFPREGKYSHACEAKVIPSIQSKDLATVGHCVVIANFQKPLSNCPALMSLSEVKTFFHEFGHALHELVGRTEWFGTSGAHVKRDFVELPSQILEEWLCDPAILKMLSSHYMTKEPLSDEMIEKIVQNKCFASGNFVQSQCYLSMVALEYFLEGAHKNTDNILQECYLTYRRPLVCDKDTHFQASWGHLYGYGPAYYGYLWSRVLALDVFQEIKKQGLLNPQVGRKYLHDIIGQGGSEDPEVLLENFLGRKPTQEAFLKSYGLTK